MAASAQMGPGHLFLRPVCSKPVEQCLLSLPHLPEQLHITMAFIKDDAILKVKLKEDSSADFFEN